MLQCVADCDGFGFGKHDGSWGSIGSFDGVTGVMFFHKLACPLDCGCIDDRIEHIRAEICGIRPHGFHEAFSN